MDFGFEIFPAITVICYLVGEWVKTTPLDAKNIPVICGTVGLVLGVVAMLIVPDFPGTDYLAAAAIGALSGFAATGINQAVKQVRK